MEKEPFKLNIEVPETIVPDKNEQALGELRDLESILAGLLDAIEAAEKRIKELEASQQDLREKYGPSVDLPALEEMWKTWETLKDLSLKVEEQANQAIASTNRANGSASAEA
jgi:hypothetical protein